MKISLTVYVILILSLGLTDTLEAMQQQEIARIDIITKQEVPLDIKNKILDYLIENSSDFIDKGFVIRRFLAVPRFKNQSNTAYPLNGLFRKLMGNYSDKRDVYAALTIGTKESILWVRKNCKKYNHDAPYYQISDAIDGKHYTQFMNLLHYFNDLIYKYPTLPCAVRQGDIWMIQKLLELGAPTVDNLTIAIKKGNLQVIEILLAAGASPFETRGTRENPIEGIDFERAVSQETKKAIVVLLRKYAACYGQ